MVRSPWFSEEGKKLISEWLKGCRKGYDDFKVAADQQYRKLEVFFLRENGAGSVETIEKSDKKPPAQQTKKAK